ncbi:hypothetical protein CLV56_0467 [Mumia flava]|uniref:Uncharacterized protein n=1 Tax=Mumia flava TaxID=1348852 RepID=A0A0B2BLA3_9ACTN|nr:hypothetical protein [Mumia flava]PJJ56263.1 hypothetical protein CLV56_0467 [Mumia flava]
MSENEIEETFETGPDDRATGDPEVAPPPHGVEVDDLDPDAEADEADRIDQAWEVALDDDFDRE